MIIFSLFFFSMEDNRHEIYGSIIIFLSITIITLFVNISLFFSARHFISRALLCAMNFEQTEKILRDNGVGAADGCSINISFLKYVLKCKAKQTFKRFDTCDIKPELLDVCVDWVVKLTHLLLMIWMTYVLFNNALIW